ncbi:serine hydrolase domain-containing protein [Rickettsia endosymbiont of Ceutorhynchus obstrictus]|uniref:serine hydrolase domain-containing protein n=1 Tax=Rickettsia endosymbiont of Ceutorhynchus obstrictus TaxID=3066249 RepID=UPI003132A83F
MPYNFCRVTSRITAKINKKLTDFIEKLELQKTELQGGAIAILYKGEVVYKTTFGNQKGDTGAITDKTLFPLASVSKPVSAIAIALMADQGSLNFDEKFKLPYLKNAVSLRNILSHTTGYQFSGNTEIEQGVTRPKLLMLLQKQQPSCKPGQCYQYSNTTFSLVEEALNCKKSSLNAAINNLRTTLKTQDIQILPIEPSAELAYPHSKKIIDGKEVITPLPFPPYYPKTVPASAGIFASIDGMIEIFKLSFCYKPNLISKNTLDRMYKIVKSNKDIFNWQLDWPIDQKMIESYYALGWRILKVKGRSNKDLIFHTGYINGINTFIGFIPSEEIGIIILLNQESKFRIKNAFGLWFDYID